MADTRSLRNLHLLASLISGSALMPIANGLVIPSWWQSGDDDSLPVKATTSPTTSDRLEVDVQNSREPLDPPPRHGSHTWPAAPEWAKETPPDVSYGSVSENLDRNLHEGNGRFLPNPVPKPSRSRPRPYFKSPKKLPTPRLQWSGDFDSPITLPPRRRPGHESAIQSDVTKQPNPLAALESKVLGDALRPLPTSLDLEYIPTTDEDWLQITNLELQPIRADSFSPPKESLPPCGGRMHFLSDPQWFERTTVLVLGMLMLFFLAVGVVEVADSVWRRLMKLRRKWPSKRGAVWLAGGEKRLSAIDEVDEEE